jgi:hypothetical protein
MPIPNFTDPEDPDVYEDEYVLRFGLEHPLDNPLQRLVGSLKWLLVDLEEAGEARDVNGLMYQSVANAYAALEAWKLATTPKFGQTGMAVEPFVEEGGGTAWRFSFDHDEAKGVIELLESGYGLHLVFPEYNKAPVALVDLFYRSPGGQDENAESPFSLVLDDPARWAEPLAAARWTRKDGLRVALLEEHDTAFNLQDPVFPDNNRAFGYTSELEGES